MSSLVVRFRWLGGRLPAVLGVGNENRLVTVMVWTRVHLVAELNLVPSVSFSEGDGVRENCASKASVKCRWATVLYCGPTTRTGSEVG